MRVHDKMEEIFRSRLAANEHGMDAQLKGKFKENDARNTRTQIGAASLREKLMKMRSVHAST